MKSQISQSASGSFRARTLGKEEQYAPYLGDMPEANVDLEPLLRSAREREKEYAWSKATELYSKALSEKTGRDASEVGEIHEALGYALYKHAFQAKNVEEYRERLDKAIEQYSKAKESYDRSDHRQKEARSLRCEGMVARLGFWRSSKGDDRKKLVNEAWSLAKRALTAFDARREPLEYGRTYNLFADCPSYAFCFEEDFRNGERITRDALELGETAADCLSKAGDKTELAKCYIRLSYLVSCILSQINPAEDIAEKGDGFLARAFYLSDETAASEMVLGFLTTGLPVRKEDEWIFRVLDMSLSCGRKADDRLIIGMAYDWIASRHYAKVIDAQDVDQRESEAELAYQSISNAHRELSLIGYIHPGYTIGYAMAFDTPHYALLTYLERDLKKKREYALKAIDTAPMTLKTMEESGSQYCRADGHYYYGLSLTGLAITEKEPEKKRRLLEQAIAHHEISVDIQTRLGRPDYASRAVAENMLANSRFDLAELAEEGPARLSLLRKALAVKKAALDLFQKGFSYPQYEEDPLMHSVFALYASEYGHWLHQVFKISADKADLVTSKTVLEQAIEHYRKAKLPMRVAEMYWEAGRVCDMLGDHLGASDHYKNASDYYDQAAGSLRHLEGLCRDYSVYMRSWSEVELAKYRHARQEPASAKEHYSKAAELHESTARWSYLSTNYSAWAHVENAEDLSQREGCRESIDAFKEAARLFKDSEMKMRDHLAKIEGPDEKQMVEKLINAADIRQELCKARIALEEARLLDKEGKLGSASEKYGLVADIFAKIKQGLATDQDRKEIDLIIILSKAWKAMAKAEAESSPELYEEAAHLFDEAKNLSPGDKAKNLAMGHSRFCRALQAGVKFSDTGDLAQHDIATNDLESAAKYYLKAGLESASEYARASKLLFDAYAQTNKAIKEEDHEKKAKLYALTEKILQASASSYEKADQPGKKEQVLKLLAKVQQDKELAVSLAEVLRAPDAVSTTMAFSSPTPSHETAAGLDRFEHADIQATVIARRRDLHVGEDLDVEIELVNAGRGSAQLTKVENVIPSGFDVVQRPENYRIEDSYIIMKGKRLDSLKTEEIALILKPKVQGRFVLKPRILYLDEEGSYKVREAEGCEVTVKELGVSGWLKGPERKR